MDQLLSTDILQLLVTNFGFAQVLKLRLLNRHANSIIENNSRFWHALLPSANDYHDVIDSLETQHMKKRLGSLRTSAAQISSQKAKHKSRLARRQDKMREVYREMEMEEKYVTYFEQQHQDIRNEIHSIQTGLRSRGIKRQHQGTIEPVSQPLWKQQKEEQPGTY